MNGFPADARVAEEIAMTRTRLVWFIIAIVVAVANGAAPGQPLPKPMDGPLPAGALARLTATFSPAMFSPDGKYFLAGSATEHHEYCLWDVASRKARESPVNGTLCSRPVAFQHPDRR